MQRKRPLVVVVRGKDIVFEQIVDRDCALVLDFMKRTSILKCGPDQLRALGPAAIALGEAEGLDGHARSVMIRFNPR